MLWNEVLNLSDGCVCLDEAHMWFSSRAWQGQSTEDLALFQQHRKEGIDLFYSVQDPARVDTAIREVTQVFVRLSRFTRFAWIERWYSTETCKGVPFKSGLCLAPRRVYDHYWTHERIGLRSGKGYGFGKSRKFEPVALDSLLQVRGTHVSFDRGPDSCVVPVESGWLLDAQRWARFTGFPVVVSFGRFASGAFVVCSRGIVQESGTCDIIE